MNQNYKYDIAFSFCQEDEGLVTEIGNLLEADFKLFIYSRKQKELAGTDGEIEFKKVFSEYSRIVVVLYREKYGKTTWTRMEEEAIRNRAYDEGYDFTLFIPLDENKATPKYLPKTRIWYNLDRFGIEGAASIISYKVSEQGGESTLKNSKEKAELLKQKLDFKRRLEYYRRSEGMSDALNEVDALFKLIETKLNEMSSGFNFGIKSEYQKFLIVNYLDVFLMFRWSYQWANDLNPSGLEVTIQKYRHSKKVFEPPIPYILKKHEYDFEKNLRWENIWRLKESNSQNYFKSDILVEKHLSDFLEVIENEEIK